MLRGCRAWWNSDDGYDLISQEVPVTIDNCWAMGNGYINSGAGRPADGNGNGFKAGSSKTGIRHVIRNSLAWGNRASGFYANHSSGGNDWFNNTAYMNGTQYNMLASPPDDSSLTIILTGALAHKMRNNIGFPNKNSNMGGVDTMFNSVGPEHHARQRRLPQRPATPHVDSWVPRAAGRQPARRQLHAPGG